MKLLCWANVSPELLGRFLGTSWAHEGKVERHRITLSFGHLDTAVPEAIP